MDNEHWARREVKAEAPFVVIPSGNKMTLKGWQTAYSSGVILWWDTNSVISYSRELVKGNFTLGQMPYHYTSGTVQRYVVPLPSVEQVSLIARPEWENVHKSGSMKVNELRHEIVSKSNSSQLERREKGKKKSCLDISRGRWEQLPPLWRERGQRKSRNKKAGISWKFAPFCETESETKAILIVLLPDPQSVGGCTSAFACNDIANETSCVYVHFC